MSYPNRNDWPTTLADARGVWCAVCLGYIPASGAPASRRHHDSHVSRKIDLERFFGERSNPADAWTVPVHQECHSHAEPKATAVADCLKTAFALPFPDLEKWAWTRHEEGDFSRSFLAKLAYMKEANNAGRPELARAMVEHAWTSKAGTSWGAHVPVPNPTKVSAEVKVVVRLNRASHMVNRGEDAQANRYLDIAQDAIKSLSKPERKAIEPSLLRRKAMIRLDLDAADEAVRVSEGKFSKTTSRFLGTAIIGMKGDLRAMRKRLDDWALGTSIPVYYLSRAYRLVGEAEAHAKAPNLKAAYQHFVKAQYIDNMLGLNPRLPLAGTGTVAFGPDDTPGERLCNGPHFCNSPNELTDLRMEAIGDASDLSSLRVRIAAALLS